MPSDEIIASFDSEPDPLIGTILAERYEILARLGQGGMSVVYKARHRLMNKMVAIKMLHPHLITNATSLLRFKQEAQAASSLNHPNVITIYDFGITAQGQPYLSMDYLDGIGLAELIEENGSLSIDRAIGIFIQACGALAHAHKMGIIHRDLKPSNIMIVPDDNGGDLVKIVDFGIAKILPGEGENIQKLTQTGEIFGSPLYMSPEQCMGEKMDARSDIYSMGCVIYETLTGEVPLKGASVLETMYKHMNEMPGGLGAIAGDVRLVQKMESIISKAMAKEPVNRYQTMLEMKSDLESAGQSSQERSVTAAKVLRGLSALQRAVHKKTGSHFKLVVSLVVLVLVLSGISLWSFTSLVFPGVEIQNAKLSWPEYQPEAPINVAPALFELQERLARGDVKSLARIWGDDDPRLASRWERLGVFYKKTGKYVYARDCFSKVIHVESRAHQGGSMLLSEGLRNMADCSYIEKHYLDAVPYYIQAIKVTEEFDGPEGPELIMPLFRLAEIFYNTGNYSASIPCYQRAISIWEGNDPFEATADYALAVSKLAAAQERTGKYDKAVALYSKALEAWQKLGKQHESALSLYQLALIYQKEGRLREAESTFELAIKAIETNEGANNPELVPVLKDYSETLWKDHRYIDALSFKVRAGQISAKQKG